MIIVNGKVLEINRFPDGTLLIKEEPYYTKTAIRWKFENNEELVALIFLTKHLRSHGVKNICLEMLYIPNARQDRVKKREDVFTLKYFAEIINSLGFEKVLVLDPHSSVSEALINNIVVGDPSYWIAEAYRRICADFGADNITFFYPDEGACKRYSGLFDSDIGSDDYIPHTFGIKERDWSTGKIKGLSVHGDIGLIKDRDILIVDDISSRGGTFYHSAKKLKELGAKRVFLYITHCENTILEGEVLTSGLIERVYTTDSLFTKEHERIEVIKR